jgi:type III restriction enzyme
VLAARGAVAVLQEVRTFLQPVGQDDQLVVPGNSLAAQPAPIEHIVRIFGLALVRAEAHTVTGATEVRHRRLSEVCKLMVRESTSLEVSKCIYTRLPYPTHSGGLERAFIEWAQGDAGIEAFCKISENRHDFVRLRYIRENGSAALYIPDFLVRTADAVYLVETKAQEQVSHPNVQRKLKAATTWCERINALEPAQRGERL